MDDLIGRYIKDNSTGIVRQVERMSHHGDKTYAVYTSHAQPQIAVRSIRVLTTRIKLPGEKGNRKNGYTLLPPDHRA